MSKIGYELTGFDDGCYYGLIWMDDVLGRQSEREHEIRCLFERADRPEYLGNSPLSGNQLVWRPLPIALLGWYTFGMVVHRGRVTRRASGRRISLIGPELEEKLVHPWERIRGDLLVPPHRYPLVSGVRARGLLLRGLHREGPNAKPISVYVPIWEVLRFFYAQWIKLWLSLLSGGLVDGTNHIFVEEKTTWEDGQIPVLVLSKYMPTGIERLVARFAFCGLARREARRIHSAFATSRDAESVLIEALPPLRMINSFELEVIPLRLPFSDEQPSYMATRIMASDSEPFPERFRFYHEGESSKGLELADHVDEVWRGLFRVPYDQLDEFEQDRQFSGDRPNWRARLFEVDRPKAEDRGLNGMQAARKVKQVQTGISGGSSEGSEVGCGVGSGSTDERPGAPAPTEYTRSLDPEDHVVAPTGQDTPQLSDFAVRVAAGVAELGDMGYWLETNTQLPPAGNYPFPVIGTPKREKEKMWSFMESGRHRLCTVIEIILHIDGRFRRSMYLFEIERRSRERFSTLAFWLPGFVKCTNQDVIGIQLWAAFNSGNPILRPEQKELKLAKWPNLRELKSETLRHSRDYQTHVRRISRFIRRNLCDGVELDFAEHRKDA